MSRPHTNPLLAPTMDRVLVWCHYHPAGVGALTGLVGEGVTSATRTGVGEHTILLEDKYYACEAAGVSVATNAVGDVIASLGAIDPSAKTIKVHTHTPLATGMGTALANAGVFPHAAVAGTLVTAADGDGTLAKLKTLCQNLCQIVEAHDDDVAVHVAADTGALTVTAWASKPGLPADLAECEAIVTEIKADWNTHRANGVRGTIHKGEDPYSTIDAADGTDQATSDTLANQLKLRINRSLQAAYTPPSLPQDIAAHASNIVSVWAIMVQNPLPG